MMRREILLLLSLGLVLVCSGCSNRQEDTGKSEVSERSVSSGDRRQESSETDREADTGVSDSNEGVVRSIPETLAQIPEGYDTPADQQGKIEKLTYMTYESMRYEEKSQRLEKTAYVYLPYGYSEEKQYNVFYLMHGGWSNETTMLVTDQQA